jgi:hypothetical protein
LRRWGRGVFQRGEFRISQFITDLVVAEAANRFREFERRVEVVVGVRLRRFLQGDLRVADRFPLRGSAPSASSTDSFGPSSPK